jgi:undecaprenyl diphosphate synthase
VAETSTTTAALPDVPQEARPRHIAIIMDGNGRWAQRQGLPRIEGHRRGVASVRRITEECARLDLAQLTLYCLSSENWKRPPRELEFLMHLLEQYMIEERSTIMEQNIRVNVIGRRRDIPEAVQREMQKTIDLSSTNTGLRLCLAINYGSRLELVDSRRSRTIFTRPACPTRTCWCERPVRCGSVIFFCGRSAIRRFG